MQAIETRFKKTEIGSIPYDWEIRKLGTCSFITKLAGFEYSLHFNSYKDEGDIIVVRGTNITHNKLDLSDIKTIPSSTSKKLLRSKLYKNDLVFAYVGTIGPIFLIEEDDKFHLGPNTSKITVNNEIDSIFLYHYFTSNFLKKEINEHTSIGAQPSLSMTKIRSFRIITPPLSEQRLIATALSDTDALISSLEKLIAKKKAIKQGAMQQLLTGKKRLPGFSGEWEVKKLGDILKIKHGKSQKEVENLSGQYPILGTGGLMSYTNHFLYDKPSVLIGRKGTINKPQFMNSPFWTVDTLFYTEINNGVSPKFIYYQFLLIDWYSYNEASGVPSLNAKTIENIEISVPNYETQNRIATILSDMDEEIAALETKCDKYKSIKQGMMQELLTGKTRLI